MLLSLAATATMRKGLVCAAMVIALLAATSAAAQSNTFNVDLVTCGEATGGETTVPAGSHIVLLAEWTETNRAAVRRFLRLENTSAAVDGNPVANASSLWGPVTAESGGYVTTWSYETGVTLSAGESLQVTYDITFRKRFRASDGTVYERGSSAFGGPISCRITASA